MRSRQTHSPASASWLSPLHALARPLRRRPSPRRPALGRTPRPQVEALEERSLLDAGLAPDLIIQLTANSAAPPPQLQSLAHAAGLTLAPTENAGQYRAHGADDALGQLTAALSGQPYVQFTEREKIITVERVPNDPKFTDGTQWDLNGTYGSRAPQAWDSTTGSTRVTVAVIDTGIDYRHADLYQNIWINQAEIPTLPFAPGTGLTGSRRSNLIDEDGDGLITLYDLNYRAPDGTYPNQGPGKITAAGGGRVITAADILRPMNTTTVGGTLYDLGTGGWAYPGNTQDGDTAHPNDFIGWNFVNNTNDPNDDYGHGTHVAGTIGAIGNNGVGIAGINWQTQLMDLKFIDSSGNGTSTAAAAAINYAVLHGAKVSNNSWGGGASQVIYNAISNAAGRGHIFVAAAGNASANADTNPLYPAAHTIARNIVDGDTGVSYSDAGLPNVISVASTDSTGSLSSFSNYGPSSVSLAAPGSSIYSTVPGGYGYLSGTSMATPHVTGTIALVLAEHSTWTYPQVMAQVLNNTRALGTLSGLTQTGGLLDANAATTLPPALAQPPDQSMQSGGTLTLTLSATNPYTGESVTYGATAGSQAYALRQQYGLFSDGTPYYNYGGQRDKWVQGTRGVWFFLLPDGTFHQWDGTPNRATGPLIATLDRTVYANPSLLYNATATAGVVSVSGNRLTITPGTFTGQLYVVATATGRATDYKTFVVTVNNGTDRPPVLTTPADATIPTGNNYAVNLSATDPDGDPITFSATVLSQAYALRQQYGFFSDGNLYFNYGGRQDKWFQGSGGAWFFILPDGNLYKWDGTANQATGALYAALDASYYNDPSLVYNAQRGATTSITGGNRLTVTPTTGFTGTLYVSVTADDGRGGRASGTFALTVFANLPPVLSQPPNGSITRPNTTYTATLSATDPDGDPITFSATVLSQAYQLRQQYGFFSDGNLWLNYGGRQEKWFQGNVSGANQGWYFILPSGAVYAWDGTPNQATGTQIATLETAYYTNPARLYNAANPATTSVSGNRLTVTLTDLNFVGTLIVNATATDAGGLFDSRTFTVTVV